MALPPEPPSRPSAIHSAIKQPAEPTERPAQRRLQLQLVWIIPLIAALIGGWLFVRSMLDHGPTVIISFGNAEGLEAGKTKVKYRDVDVGVVRTINFDSHFDRVLIKAEIKKEIAPLLVQDTRFWIVRPRVGAGGVSGLGTLLSGAYLSMDVGKSLEEQREFTGLEKPPTITAERPGRRFNLRAHSVGSIDIGSPVYFRRVQVGGVTSVELDPEGNGVLMEIFIDSPYERYVTQSSRFWEASGVDITFDAGGFKVNTQSIASVLAGGIAFASAPQDQPRSSAVADEGTEFRLASDQVQAMREPDSDARLVRMYFSESLRGLQVGAPVDFRGVVIGEIKSIGVEYDPAKQSFRFPVDAQIYPQRLWPNIPSGSLPADPKQVFITLIKRGLRAQLRSGNLLTGQLYVALEFFPSAPKVTIEYTDSNEVPTIGGSLGEFQASISELLGKINKVPYQEISADLRATLQSTTQTLQSTQRAIDQLSTDLSPSIQKSLLDLQNTLAHARQTLDHAGQTVSPNAAWQIDLRDSLREITKAAQSLRNLTDSLSRHPESLLRGNPGDPSP